MKVEEAVSDWNLKASPAVESRTPLPHATLVPASKRQRTARGAQRSAFQQLKP